MGLIHPLTAAKYSGDIFVFTMEFDDQELAIIYASICVFIQAYSSLLEETTNKEDKLLIEKLLESSMSIEEKIRRNLNEEPTPRPKW